MLCRVLKQIAGVTLCSFINSIAVFPAVAAYAAQNETVPKATGQDYNKESSVMIDPATGLPYGARGMYTPAEKNPLLGRSVFMTSLECAQRYGINFCSCGTLQDGTPYCYYNRPTEGFYESKEACEQVWGAGMCICPEGQSCRLYEPEEAGRALACNGDVVFFSGEKMECRKAGVLSMGQNCCRGRGKGDSACSFENTAEEVGMDDIAMLSMTIGTQLASLAGYDPRMIIGKMIAEQMVNTWIANGSVGSLSGSMVSLFGPSNWSVTQAIFEVNMDVVAETAAQQGVDVASAMATDAAAKAATEQAIAGVAQALSTMVSVAGWVYFAYQMYNMYTMLRQCTAGEYILSCKKAKGICHRVGSRCKIKVLGICLQSMEVQCCFNSVIARIINEQGRPQIGRRWGSAKKPDCRGLRLDEFAKIDLSAVDFGEYQEDLIRELNPNVQEKYKKAVERLNDSFVP